MFNSKLKKENAVLKEERASLKEELQKAINEIYRQDREYEAQIEKVMAYFLGKKWSYGGLRFRVKSQ